MTSPLSRNALALTPISKKYYLHSNKEGYPLNKQVPRTIQTYNGTGGTTISYDGSNDIVIVAENLTSNLIISFCPSVANDRLNLLGKEVKIHITGPTTRSITLNSAPVFMKINGTSLTQVSHIIPGDGLSKTITVSFATTGTWNVDYGASASPSLLPTTLPSVSFQRVTYVYGRFAFTFVPSVYIPNSATYNLVLGDLNRDSEGFLLPGSFPTSLTGAGQVNVFFFYYPASRRLEPTNVYGTIYQGSVYFGSFTIQMSPILSGVYDFPYFTGSNTGGTLKSLRLDESNVDRLAIDANGGTVELNGDLIAIANSIADSLYFFVYSDSDTVIRFTSFISDLTDVFLDVSTISATFWTPGARIADIEYDEKDKCLYVLPGTNGGLLLRVPVIPMDQINRPDDIPRTGCFTVRQLTIVGANALNSIAVCPLTSALYVSYSRLVGNLSVNAYQDFDSLSLSFTYIHPSIPNGRIAIGFTALGQFLIHYEATKLVVSINNARPFTSTLGDLYAVFTLNSFSASLSRTCYGWTQGKRQRVKVLISIH